MQEGIWRKDAPDGIFVPNMKTDENRIATKYEAISRSKFNKFKDLY